MRINRTREEQARRRAKAAKAVSASAAHYAKPGVWDAEFSAAQADLNAALSRGDDTAARAARNAITVLNLHKPGGRQ